MHKNNHTQNSIGVNGINQKNVSLRFNVITARINVLYFGIFLNKQVYFS